MTAGKCRCHGAAAADKRSAVHPGGGIHEWGVIVEKELVAEGGFEPPTKGL
jgi:hypothetical protein